MKMYQRLKDIREDNDLQQSDIAHILSTTQQQVSKWETGVQMMGVDKYMKLAKHFNISLDYITGLTNIPTELYNKEIPPKFQKLISAYSENSDLQPAVDKLLGI